LRGNREPFVIGGASTRQKGKSKKIKTGESREEKTGVLKTFSKRLEKKARINRGERYFWGEKEKKTLRT